jgi:hypothetical protein
VRLLPHHHQRHQLAILLRLLPLLAVPLRLPWKA